MSSFYHNFSYKVQPAGGSTSSFSSRTLDDHSHSSTISPPFTAYFFAHILSLRGRKQMFKACSCSAARDLKTVEMSETFSDGEINRHGKHVKQKPISSFRIILSVMVSNSVYMSSLLWYKQSYFVLATQRLLWVPMWSWKITEKKKKHDQLRLPVKVRTG